MRKTTATVVCCCEADATLVVTAADAHGNCSARVCDEQMKSSGGGGDVRSVSALRLVDMRACNVIRAERQHSAH